MNDSFLAEFFQKILDYRKQEMGEHDVRRYCMFHNPWLISYNAPAFYTAGWVALSQFAPPSTRKYGCKASFFVGALLGAVGVAVQISALKPEAVDIRRRMLIAGRAVEGLGFGFLSQVNHTRLLLLPAMVGIWISGFKIELVHIAIPCM